MTAQTIPTAHIRPGNNDRKVFARPALEELAASMGPGALDLVQAITIRPIGADQYQIVAGERRFRAMTDVLGLDALIVGKHCVIMAMDDQQASKAMLVENTARVSLNAVEEARAYSERIAAYFADVPEKQAIKEIAAWAGVSTVIVTHRLKLLRLCNEVLDLVRSGNFDVGYATDLANSDLDNNFQVLALREFNNNPSPARAWFRRVCQDLYAKQAQQDIFAWGGLDSPALAVSARAADPPTPESAAAPWDSRLAPAENLLAQAAYWQEAAAAWTALGKSFKAQQCSAAALTVAAAAAQLATLKDELLAVIHHEVQAGLAAAAQAAAVPPAPVSAAPAADYPRITRPATGWGAEDWDTVALDALTRQPSRRKSAPVVRPIQFAAFTDGGLGTTTQPSLFGN